VQLFGSDLTVYLRIWTGIFSVSFVIGPALAALAYLERTEGTSVRTIVGINEDGVFGTSRAGRYPDLPGACKEPFIPLLWLKVHELLGRVPEGSTAQFVQDGTLPGEAQGGATVG
jgi:hypothetical protein